MICAVALPANADTIFSTFGPDGSFDCCGGYAISGSKTVSGYNANANQFTPTITASVAMIERALFAFDLAEDSVTVQLRADVGGRPGSVLESYTLTNMPSFAEIRLVNSTVRSRLNAGTAYWLSVLPGTETTLGGWTDAWPFLTGTTKASTQ